MSTRKRKRLATGEKGGEEFDVVFREVQPGEEEEEQSVFQIARPGPIKGKRKKKGTKKGKKKREVLFRTKVRRKLLKEYHSLIRKRKAINKALRDNRRHRNQLVFHRK